MKWLSLEDIKKQLRIEPDFTEEDDLLTRYGNSAEASILNLTGRTYEELKEMNPVGENEIPADLWEATVMLVVSSDYHRGAVDIQQCLANPGFTMKLKPYVRLADKDE